MKIEERIKALREKIKESLIPLIDGDYVFLDLPYYSNIGDSLIWRGTEDFLKFLPHKCLYRCSLRTFQFKSLPKDVVIIMQGGGNWGDLYPQHNEFRKKIIELYPNNKIIVLPQTVYYEGARNVRWDAKVFRDHKNLVLCARDKYTYWFLNAFRFSKKVMLVPDMAFYIDSIFLKSTSLPASKKGLLFKRIDKECSDLSEVEKVLSVGYATGDWPQYEGGDPQMEILEEFIREKRLDEADRYALNTYLPTRVETGIRFISSHDIVISNRLHGALLAILLGKDVYIVDNSYGKNSQFYDTWLSSTDGVKLLKSKSKWNLKRCFRFTYHWLLSLFDCWIQQTI